MSSKNSLERKKIRRAVREVKAKFNKPNLVEKWVPVEDKYGRTKFVSITMPTSMFK